MDTVSAPQNKQSKNKILCTVWHSKIYNKVSVWTLVAWPRNSEENKRAIWS